MRIIATKKISIFLSTARVVFHCENQQKVEAHCVRSRRVLVQVNTSTPGEAPRLLRVTGYLGAILVRAVSFYLCSLAPLHSRDLLQGMLRVRVFFVRHSHATDARF